MKNFGIRVGGPRILNCLNDFKQIGTCGLPLYEFLVKSRLVFHAFTRSFFQASKLLLNIVSNWSSSKIAKDGIENCICISVKLRLRKPLIRIHTGQNDFNLWIMITKRVRWSGSLRVLIAQDFLIQVWLCTLNLYSDNNYCSELVIKSRYCMC